MKTNTKVPKTPFFAAFSVGAVLFSAHAGGGFATGNQANTYYVGLGWTGIISAVVAMLLLTLTMREAMIMYNSRGLTSYKQLFETLYHPFDKIEWAFEVFFYIMVLMAVAAAISGAASALNNYFTINYYIGVAIVGVIVLMLTIFGAGIVRAASTYMGMAILVTAISIYVIGIFKSDSSIFSVLAADFETTGFMNMPKAILNAFTYAGFQCVTLPTMIACGTTMKNKAGCAKAMWISFVMNAVALVLSVFMLMNWQSVYTSVEGGTTIPTLTVCKVIGIPAMVAVYGTCLLLSDKQRLKEILKDIRELMDGWGLELNQKTGIFPLRNGIDFLGFHSYITESGGIIQKLRRDSIQRIRAKVKFWEEAYKRGEVTKDAILQSFGAWDAHAAYGDTHELRAKYAKKVEAIIGEPVEIHRKLNGNRAVRDKRRLRQCRNLYKKQHQNRETEKSGSFSYAQRPTDVPPWADS